MTAMVGSRGLMRTVATLATALALLAAGCQASAQSLPQPGATVQLVEARQGRLSVAVNATGSVALSQQDRLTFGSVGSVGNVESASTVETVAVKWGQSIKKGQVLIKLNTKDLELQVAKATTNLASALDAQEKALAFYTAGDLAKAEAAVQSAQAAVQSAQSALDKAKTPYSAGDVAKAEAAVQAAQAAVESAQSALDKAKAPYSAGDVAKAEAAVRSAQAAGESAQAAVGSAQATVESTRATVQTAQAALDRARATQPINLASARGSVADAQVALAAAQRAQASVRTQQDSLVRQAEDTLANARTTYVNALRSQGYTAPEGDAIYDFAPVSSLGPATTTANITLFNNWRALINARDALTVARATRESALAAADNAVLGAQRTLAAAQNELDLLLAGADQATIQARQADLQAAQASLKARQAEAQARQADLQTAQASLKKAQEELDAIRNGPNAAGTAGAAAAADIALKASALQTAQANLKKAQEDLDAIKNGPRAAGAAGAAAAADIALKASALQTAQANLKKAQEDLETVRQGADAIVLLLRQSDVDNARRALADAQDNLAKAAIAAPYDGIVADVPVVAGQRVTANTVVVTVVDPNAVEINAQVDEIDLAQLRVGQQAAITLEALPGARLAGQVSAIAPIGTVQQGVVSYKIAISVRPQPGIVLRDGMTAQANIVVSTKENVLLVPARAVRSQGGTRVVRVAVEGTLNGRIEERTVQVEATNETQAEIVSGLKEGEKVVVEGGTARPFQGFGAPGGGLGVPGGGVTGPVRR